MYKAVEYFKDLQDNRHEYKPGDVYPRAGLNVSLRRINSLAGSDNGMGKPLIEFVKEATNGAPKEAEKAEEAKPVKTETAKPKKGRKKSAE